MTDRDEPDPAMPVERPVLVYDGDCGFCTYWARRWQQKAQGRIAIVPLQDREGRPPGLATAELEEAVHLVEPDGTIRRGAAAIFEVMGTLRPYRLARWAYRWIPPFRWFSNWLYRWVANHRAFVSRRTRWMRRREL